MAQAEKKSPGIAESQAFAYVTFYIERRNGTYSTHDADCLINSVISGLKEDLQKELGPPSTQTWVYNNEDMANNKRLIDYEIDGSCDIKIVVKPTIH